MEKHYGQIVEYIVRKNGYSISDLAKEMKVNRRSIYNWFNQPYLKKDIILPIGCILRHDFSEEIPEMFTQEDFKCCLYEPDKEAGETADSREENVHYKDKYVTLLEQYNQLLLDSL